MTVDGCTPRCCINTIFGCPAALYSQWKVPMIIKKTRYPDASGYRESWYPDASGYRQNMVPWRVGVPWIVVPWRVGVPWIVVPRCVMIDLDQSEQQETILLLWLVQVKVWSIRVPRFTVPRRVGEPCFAGTLTRRGTMNHGTPTRRGTTIPGTLTRRGTSFFW